MKLLLNYRYDSAPMCTAYYFERACRKLGHTVFHTDDFPVDVDGIINIDECSSIILIAGVKSLYWETDSFFPRSHPINYENADKVFVGGSSEDLIRYAEGSIYLPHAADEDLHKAIDVPKEYDIAFSGSSGGGYEHRDELLANLAQKYKVINERTYPGSHYAKLLSSGKMIFNHSLSEFNIGMRVPEAMYIGVLLTNNVPEMKTFGENGVHYLAYNSEAELHDLIDKYKDDPKALEKINKASTKLIKEKHLYTNRVEEMLKYV